MTIAIKIEERSYIKPVSTFIKFLNLPKEITLVQSYQQIQKSNVLGKENNAV